MRELRHQASICLLIGLETDRESWAAYFEQAGYRVNIFKNPLVFFDYLREFNPFVVVLETTALRSRLSGWVSQLQALRPQQSWIAVAPINQYPILASYQNRNLAEIVTSDQPYIQERLLWALDRELTKWNFQNSKPKVEIHRDFDFIEDSPSANLEILMETKFRESQLLKKPFCLGLFRLDDPAEIETFWGAEVLQKVSELLMALCLEKWGPQKVILREQSYYILINSTVSQFISEAQSLQRQLQEQGREQFGFRLSISGGVAESFVHARDSAELLRRTTEACQSMTTKGGGRVGIPKPIEGDSRGTVSQDMG